MADRFLYPGLVAPLDAPAPQAADTSFSWFVAGPPPGLRPRPRQLGEVRAEGAGTAEIAQPLPQMPTPPPTRPAPRQHTAFTYSPDAGATPPEFTPFWHASPQWPRVRPETGPEAPAAPPADLSQDMPLVIGWQLRRAPRQQTGEVSIDLASGPPPPAVDDGMPFVIAPDKINRRPRFAVEDYASDAFSFVLQLDPGYPTLGYTLPDSKLGYTLDVGITEYRLPASKLGYTLE